MGVISLQLIIFKYWLHHYRVYTLRNLNVSNKSLFARAEQKNVEAVVTNYLEIPCLKLV